MTTHVSHAYDFSHPETAYAELARDLGALLGGERDLIANAANTSALIWQALPELNWAGFYLYKSGELVLGPFQGKPACVRIAIGKGVCGTAAQRRETLVVEDVNAFPGHIACDSASNSEIVIPLLRGGELLGVLDLDSPRPARFGPLDARGLERLARIFLDSLQAPRSMENAGERRRQ
jgi:GAF domain-containing protein